MNKDRFRNKRVLIVGLARSGFACARTLRAHGAQVAVTDNKDVPATCDLADRLRQEGIAVELGLHTRGFFETADMVVVSPGVPDTAGPVAWALAEHRPVISEIEAGWMLCPCPVIAVTGSCGKTTVTTLIASVLERAGRTVACCGNIGTPFTAEVGRLNKDDVAVLEVSSFQLEHIRTFAPHIAVITNISRNHLDRYPGMAEYIAAKARIFENQGPSDFAVLNAEDPELVRMAKTLRSPVRSFRRTDECDPNRACVIEVARIMGIAEDICSRTFAAFKGLSHRMEEVAVIKGVIFINDSKATTSESCLWALQNIDRPAILIAGGRDKGVDYTVIAQAARTKVKQAILIGEAAARIGEALAGVVPVCSAASLEEAVASAYAQAAVGDCVLLSPMCSSFDMFRDYEARGQAFKDAVLRLAGATAGAP